MPLSVPNLDDLRFQKDLVDEARRRIIRYCPEWTDYNLSDPGITLIELFAWMTEMIVYRLNRVPEKNYIKFMELLGMQLQPASSARVELTFRLSVPFPIDPEDDTVATVPQGLEVATQPTDEEDEIIFTVDEKLTIRPPKLTQLRRASEFHKNYLPRLGIEIFRPFGDQKPESGAMFYMGFHEEEDISGHLLQLFFKCERTQAAGIKREDPPLVWECSMGDGNWEEVSPSNRTGEKDTTGGLNNPEGRLVFYLPLLMKPDVVNGRNAYWLRCRIEQRRSEQGMYSESPRIKSVETHSLGAATRATHAVIIRDEIVGHSQGEPGQRFHLQNAPVLDLRTGETLEVEEKGLDETKFVPWHYVSDFSRSKRYDRHFMLDTATGEIQFGPAIRMSDGSVKQYGRVPESHRAIRFRQYRHGGGVIGNVPPGRIHVLKSAVPYIDQVTNLIRASGGRNQETLEELKMRTRRELRAQLRAVTPEDYEDLAKKASRSIARVKCNVPQQSNGRLPPGMVEILLVPAVADSLKVGDLSKLQLDFGLRQEVEAFLDSYRLITTTLHIRDPEYIGIKVEAEIVPSEDSHPDLVRTHVIERLRNFISPLLLDDKSEVKAEGLMSDEAWEGWPFGRDLYVAEIFSLIQRVPGVQHVLDVQLNQRPVVPRNELKGDEDEAEVTGSLKIVEGRVVRISSDTLLCSLDHEIKIINLGEGDND